jgi:hypothetical protein
MVIVASIYLGFYVGVGTFLPTPSRIPCNSDCTALDASACMLQNSH